MIDGLVARRNGLINSIAEKQAELKQVLEAIKESGEIYVSHHAITRYRQRIAGKRKRDIIKKLTNPVVKARMLQYGNGRYLASDCIAVLEDNIIVTVLPIEK